MTSTPSESPKQDAAELFVAFVAATHADIHADFEALCKQRPRESGELRERFSIYLVLQDDLAVFGKGRKEKEESTYAGGARGGDTIGDFKLVSRIASGGQGEVWEAEQGSLNRRVALKLVLPDRINERTLALFAREARAGGRLHHPGIVTVYGYGLDDGKHWIAQELVEGSWTLRDFIDEMRSSGELPENYYRAVAVFVAELADALQAAHDEGILHRDVKPQNILVTKEDRPKLTDFGLARITDETAMSLTGDFAGTWLYMSPEQVTAKRIEVDHRTDIFSLGVVFYEMLSLQRPFDGDTTHQIAENIIYREPPDLRKIRSRVPRDLSAICGHSLEKRKSDRYSTMAELAADIRRHLSGDPILASPPGQLLRLWIKARRHPGVVAIGILVAALVVLGGRLLTASSLSSARRAAQTAILVTDKPAGSKLALEDFLSVGEHADQTGVPLQISDAVGRILTAPASAGDLLSSSLAIESVSSGPEALCPPGMGVVIVQRSFSSAVISGPPLFGEVVGIAPDEDQPHQVTKSFGKRHGTSYGIHLGRTNLTVDALRYAVAMPTRRMAELGVPDGSVLCATLSRSITDLAPFQQARGIKAIRKVQSALRTVLAPENAHALVAVAIDLRSRVVVGSWSATDFLGAPADTLPVAYPLVPGALAIPITLALGVDQGVASSGELFDVSEIFRLGRRAVYEDAGVQLGMVTLEEGATRTVNSVAAQVGLRIDSSVLHDTYLGMGFGASQETSPSGWNPGYLSRLPWKREYTHLSVCIGHEIVANLWQLGAAMCAIMDDGEWTALVPRGCVVQNPHRFRSFKAISRDTALTVRKWAAESLETGRARGLGGWDLDLSGAFLGESEEVASSGRDCGGRACRQLTCAVLARLGDEKREILLLVAIDAPRTSRYANQVLFPVVEQLVGVIGGE